MKLGLVTLMAAPMFIQRAFGSLKIAFSHAMACRCKEAMEHAKQAHKHVLETQKSLTTVHADLPTEDAKKELGFGASGDDQA